jgi:hypothetical protein
MVLQLDPVIWSEETGIAPGGGQCFLSLAGQQQCGNFSPPAAGESGQSLGPGFEIAQGDLGIVLMVELRLTDDAAEIGVAAAVASDQDEVGFRRSQRMVSVQG